MHQNVGQNFKLIFKITQIFGEIASKGWLNCHFPEFPLHFENYPKNDQFVLKNNPSPTKKGYYTVIKNVRKTHQIQDSGEFQEFNDDVDYILEGLGSHNNLSTRCLSTVTLASKCMEPAFRYVQTDNSTPRVLYGGNPKNFFN